MGFHQVSNLPPFVHPVWGSLRRPGGFQALADRTLPRVDQVARLRVPRTRSPTMEPAGTEVMGPDPPNRDRTPKLGEGRHRDRCRRRARPSPSVSSNWALGIQPPPFHKTWHRSTAPGAAKQRAATVSTAELRSAAPGSPRSEPVVRPLLRWGPSVESVESKQHQSLW